jgi:hypothetical protein
MNEQDLRTALSPYCAEVVRWLDGETDTLPTHGGPPDEETTELIEDLRVANTLGLWTLGSQPSRPNQRAVLEAVTTPYRAQHLTRRALAAGLWAVDWRLAAPMTLGRVSVTEPVTEAVGPTTGAVRAGTLVDESGAFTYVTAEPGLDRWIRDDILLTYRDAPAISACHAVILIDPAWNRSRHLWDSLRAALDHTDWASNPATATTCNTP